MTVAVATLLDHALREPPLAVHPTRLVGVALDRVARAVPSGPPVVARRRGGLAWSAGAVTAVVAGTVGERWARRSPAPAVARGVLLWPLLSRRMLLDEVVEVGVALHRDLSTGRARAARLVSRDLTAATEAEVADAAIGTLAENASDALVATLWWYAVAGLPGAALHRFANTADACWGYRDGRWQDAGRVAARADDLLNLVPARLTAWALRRRGTPWGVLRREARRTPSPNGGWPMAATALALDVRIAKPGHYVLHAEGRIPDRDDISHAVEHVARRSWAPVAGLALVAAGRHRLGRQRRNARHARRDARRDTRRAAPRGGAPCVR